MKKKKYSRIHENFKAGISSGHFLANIVLANLIINATFKLIEHFEDSINPKLIDILDLITISVAFVFAIVNCIVSIRKNKNDREEFDIRIDDSIIEKTVAAPINNKYFASGYKWYNSKRSYALSSYDINKDLLTKPEKYLLSYDGKPDKLNERQKRILLKLYKDKKKNKVLLFNDPHPALRSDIYFDKSDKKILKVKKTNYFAHITSNQIIYKKFYNADSTLFYDGWRMTLNDDYSYKNIECSRAANMFGVSSLLVSSDNFLIISRQGRKNDSGVNQLIPSATGSVDIKDFNFNHFEINDKKKLYYLNDLITNAGIRETNEETHVKSNYIIDRHVVGYMRMLFLGGHPEFMCLFKSSLTKDEIVCNFIKCENIGVDNKGVFLDRVGEEIDELNTQIKLEDVYKLDVDELIEQKLKDENISIQLYMLLKTIHQHHQEKVL